MENKDFYESLISYERQGLIKFMPTRVDDDFLKIKIGKKIVTVHISVAEFAREMKSKEETGEFLPERQLEAFLNRSPTFIKKLVENGRLVRITRGKNVKFYIKKDWED